MELQLGHLKAIARSILRGKCVPFLGAAVNMKCADYDGLPLGTEVSERIVETYKYEVTDKWNLPRVSLIHDVIVKRTNLLEDLRRMLVKQKLGPSRILTTLAEMPLDLYITTNYDRLLEQALEAAKRPPIVVVQTTTALENRSGIDQWIEIEEGKRPPLVYKIHGSFREAAGDSPDEVIITEDDYIDFLTLLGSKENGIPNTIAERLKNDTLLFLGYSLEDWDFRVLYKIIMRSYEGHRFIKPRFSVQKVKKEKAYWLNFWANQKVDILEVDVYEFIDRLKAAYAEELAGAANAGP